jgi:hypothetical protein
LTSIMHTELGMEAPRTHGDARYSRRAAAAAPLRVCLLALLGLAGKLAAPIAIVAAAFLGYSLQGSLTMSQTPSRAEDPDASVRAQMLKPISERLFGAKSNAGDLAPAHDGMAAKRPEPHLRDPRMLEPTAE